MEFMFAWLTLAVQVQVPAITVQAGQIAFHSLENTDAPCLGTGTVRLNNASMFAQVANLRVLTHDAHEHDVVKMYSRQAQV